MKCEKSGKETPNGIGYFLNCESQEKIDLVNQDINNESNDEEIKTDELVDNTFVTRCQCGQKLKANWKFCPQCKRFINNKSEESNDTNTQEKGKNPQIYVIIYLISMTLGFSIRSKYDVILLLTGLVIIITGKINCPQSQVIKGLFWLTMLHIAGASIMILLLFSMCGPPR